MKFDEEMSVLSSKQLMQRIFDTIENPPGVINWEDGSDFFAWIEDVPYMYIGTAVALYGCDIPISLYRGKLISNNGRCERRLLINASWYYLMWFEMAICSLCEGDIQTYNKNPIGLPQMKFMFIPKITETNYKIYEKLILL